MNLPVPRLLRDCCAPTHPPGFLPARPKAVARRAIGMNYVMNYACSTALLSARPRVAVCTKCGRAV